MSAKVHATLTWKMFLLVDGKTKFDLVDGAGQVWGSVTSGDNFSEPWWTHVATAIGPLGVMKSTADYKPRAFMSLAAAQEEVEWRVADVWKVVA